jgi:lipopolysaccharide transport system ATP-binding protein
LSNTVIKVENLSKQYRLGNVSMGTLSHDLNRWWYGIRGKDDPYLKIGEENDRSKKGASDYVWALRDINFEVKQGEVLGIIGRNGAGKSTLLKILSRTTTPTIGSVKLKGRVASLLEVGTGFHPELTGRENIFLNGAILGMTKKEIKTRFDEIVDFAGVERYIDTPVKRYSSGMYVRLAFAVAAHLEPEILIVDEVLAVGDAEFQKKAIGKLKDVSDGDGRTVLFVSHNMSAVKKLCTKGMLLEHGITNEITDIDNVIQKYLRVENVSNTITNEVFFADNGKELRVTECNLTDGQGNLVDSSIGMFDRVFVTVKYKFIVKIPRLNLTILIHNDSSEIVYFIDRRDTVYDFATLDPGEYESKIEVPNPLLKPGQYFITIGCNDVDSGIEDHKHFALAFVIENVSEARSSRDGHLFFPVKWEIEKVNLTSATK